MRSFIKWFQNTKRNRLPSKPTTPFRPALESLESRDVPSITLINSTTLFAHGDDAHVRNDTYQLHTRADNGRLQLVQFDGTTKIATMDVPTGVTQIGILGDGGTDTIRVEVLPSGLTLTTADIEVVNVGNARSLANVQGKIVLTTNSGGPATAVAFDGSADATDHSITLTRDRLSGLTPQFTDFSHVRLNSLTVSTGSGVDSVRILSTKAATTINTGAGTSSIG